MQDGSGSAGGEALEAAGFEVVLVTVEPSQSGLRLFRVDLLVGGGVGDFTASDGAVRGAVGLCVSVSESDSSVGGAATSTGGAGGSGGSG